MGLAVSPRRAGTLIYTSLHPIPLHPHPHRILLERQDPFRRQVLLRLFHLSPSLLFSYTASGVLQGVPGDQRSAPRWLSVSSRGEKELHNLEKHLCSAPTPCQNSLLNYDSLLQVEDFKSTFFFLFLRTRNVYQGLGFLKKIC